jgi:multidrug efflux pump subunit AcrB
MVPFAAFSRGSWIYGSPKLERYNGSPFAEILGEPAPGLSTGSAIDIMEKLAEKLPPGEAQMLIKGFIRRTRRSDDAVLLLN